MNSPRAPWQTIAIALAAAGLLLLALGGYLQPISQLALQPVLPIQQWLSSRYQIAQNIVNAPADVAQLRAENAELEAEIARLQTEVISLQQQVNEVDVLSALLDFARAQPANQVQAAAVIGRDPSPFLQYILINRGSNDGLRRGMPVVSTQGLVGRIVAVTSDAARVQLITDPASTVNVQIGAGKVSGVLAGSITADLNVELIPQDATVAAGDLVLTSGLGGNYPANILVGQLSSVRSEATNLFQTAALQSVTDFSQLEIVLVIINFRPIDVTPLQPETLPVP
jgi:rod shape-determining protein MreC